jgi:hypothetical protein
MLGGIAAWVVSRLSSVCISSVGHGAVRHSGAALDQPGTSAKSHSRNSKSPGQCASEGGMARKAVTAVRRGRCRHRGAIKIKERVTARRLAIPSCPRKARLCLRTERLHYCNFAYWGFGFLQDGDVGVRRLSGGLGNRAGTRAASASAPCKIAKRPQRTGCQLSLVGGAPFVLPLPSSARHILAPVVEEMRRNFPAAMLKSC